MPLKVEDKPSLLLEVPYLASVLARAQNMETESKYFWRIYHDDDTEFSQVVFISSQEKKENYLLF